MTKTLDGLNFDLPPTEAQIVDAHQHQKFRIFLGNSSGNFCLARKSLFYPSIGYTTTGTIL